MSQDFNIADLSPEELMKSPTWRRYADECGICSRCSEHTSVLDPCCSSTVYFEGGEESPDDLWAQIEVELGEMGEAENEGNDEED